MIDKLYHKKTARDVALLILISIICIKAKEVGYIFEFIRMFKLATWGKLLVTLTVIAICQFSILAGNKKDKYLRVAITTLIALLLITANRSYYEISSNGLIDDEKVTQHQLDTFTWLGVDTESLRVK